ncbi:MAG: MBOAT family O-acyltransferase [Kofleriaceae bacterium]
MLFSNPDYPVFLVAVFFLYALSRGVDPLGKVARIAIMLLLGDVVFLLVAKDPALLWDPLGNVVFSIASGRPIEVDVVQWLVGAGVFGGCVWIGVRAGGWLATDRAQKVVGVGMVVVVLCVGVALAIASRYPIMVWDWETLAPKPGTEITSLTWWFIENGHLIVLGVLGVGIGAAQVASHRTLGRVIVLFVASGLFYQAWAVEMPGAYHYLLALLLFTIVLDYYLGIWIEESTDPVMRRVLVIVSLCSNLGILFYFKYAFFFGLQAHHLILPAGISFHTFQSLSYTIDVYRKELKATRSPIQFATFVLFFPQLVAGPIVRAQDLLPQLSDLPILELEKATRGLFRIVVGLFKKIALADTLAIAIVDRVFDTPGHFTSLEVLAGVYGYAFQIYLDFSAYSDIAIGSAEVLGFDLPENFRTPYRSASLQEFWRRWHISLSTWLRDYLYIALGGSRGAPWRTYVNLALTMLLGGLWHGANWTFVVWGGLHGFGLAITRFFQRAKDPKPFAIGCAILAAFGCVGVTVVPGTWAKLIIAWSTITPLWAVATAWLSRVEWTPTYHARGNADFYRVASCAVGAAVIATLDTAQPWLTLVLVAVAWGLAVMGDFIAVGRPGIDTIVRRFLAAVLTFQYVCLAWIFFRAESFDRALAVLRAIGDGSWGRANVTPMVQLALGVGLAAHFWADGTFRWMRDRWVALPAWAQGLVLAAAAMILRELSHAKLVKFIYFEF